MAEAGLPRVEAGNFLKIHNAEEVYEHLTNVLLKISQERPEDCLSTFESLSIITEPKEEEASPASKALYEASALKNQEVLHLIKAPKKAKGDDEEEEEEEDEEKEPAPMPDLMTESSLLEWAGFGMPKAELWKWVLSIQKLATDKELQNVRFWGQIRGTGADYTIVEAKLEEYPEEEETEGENRNEPLGQGANEHIYYVANSATGEWSLLPPVKAEHIQLARQMKRFFSGDLNRQVLGFPRFPYGEAAYLRAQIARINAGAFLAPVGVSTVDPEDEEQTVVENEEYTGITPMTASLKTWVHARTHLLKEGRTTEWVNPEAEEEEEEDEEGEAKTKDQEEKEVPPPKLNPIVNDEGEAWRFGVFPHAADPAAMISAISTRWPGAVAVAQGKAYVNFYSGWGVKSGNGWEPPMPPAMATEYQYEFKADEASPLEEQTDVQPPADWVAPVDEEEEDADLDVGEEGAAAPEEEAEE